MAGYSELVFAAAYSFSGRVEAQGANYFGIARSRLKGHWHFNLNLAEFLAPSKFAQFKHQCKGKLWHRRG
ncbi:MAG: hypothetical protein R2880_11095 [Deinococcales bacterium]